MKGGVLELKVRGGGADRRAREGGLFAVSAAHTTTNNDVEPLEGDAIGLIERRVEESSAGHGEARVGPYRPCQRE